MSVERRVEESITWITMDDGKANALSPQLIGELSEALSAAEKDTTSAVIITGRAGRFSGGFDLSIMKSGPDAAMKMVMEGGKLFMRLYLFPKPVVMAVSGHAIAGGILLASSGDVRVGVDGDFKLGLNEVATGMPVPILALELARDRLDPRELVPATLYSKIYPPREAVTAGWLDMCVAPESLREVAQAEAKRLGALPQRAFAATKRALRQRTVDVVHNTLDANLAQLVGKTP